MSESSGVLAYHLAASPFDRARYRSLALHETAGTLCAQRRYVERVLQTLPLRRIGSGIAHPVLGIPR